MKIPDALDQLVLFAPTMIAPLHAELIARAFGRSLDVIGVEAKSFVRIADERMSSLEPGFQNRTIGLLHGQRPQTGAVLMDELATSLAVHFGLFGGRDHANQVPLFDSAVERVRYICGRSAVRLAWLFEGDEGVAALRERDARRAMEAGIPRLDRRIFAERFKPDIKMLGSWDVGRTALPPSWGAKS